MQQFNLKRYKELKLKKKNLGKRSSSDFKELLEYEASIIKQICYEKKK